MEENTITMQALVIAHACYGHNAFFKGNHLFRQWTQADAILDYLVFARRYVMECEERHGAEAVEEVLDACHALMPHGVDRYRRPAAATLRAETARLAEREAHRERQFNDLWRTLPEAPRDAGARQLRTFPGRSPGEHPLFRREALAKARALAARAGAHRAQARAVFPSAGADQGDERGLGHVLALHDHQPAARAGSGRRRVHARVPEEPHQRRRPACVRFQGLRRAQSLRAGLRDVRRPPAHLRGAGCRGPRLVPGHCRKRLAEDARLRDAQFQGRIVHRPVPVAAADAPLPPVRHRRPRRGGRSRRRQHPRRARLPPRAQAAGAAVRDWRHRFPTSRCCATTATATAR